MINNKNNKTLSSSIEDQLDQFFEMHAGDCPESGLYNLVVKEVEKVLIKKTLSYVDGVQVKASRILGINRNTLRKKMQEFNID
ncbi:MAG: helix-turn-helix domain-containing protein [Rickettsiaceae bacterium]|nr:helix-turn-helix domain-containing protein [Rickettsiaceae bacterium]